MHAITHVAAEAAALEYFAHLPSGLPQITHVEYEIFLNPPAMQNEEDETGMFCFNSGSNDMSRINA
jgi:hypothetical protein